MSNIKLACGGRGAISPNCGYKSERGMGKRPTFLMALDFINGRVTVQKLFYVKILHIRSFRVISCYKFFIVIKMKRICAIMAGLVAFSCYGQTANGTFEASISGVERLSLVKTSIDVPTWHEKTFWPVYETYLSNSAEVSSQTYRALDDLARTTKSSADDEALNNGKKLIQYRYDEFALLQKYYEEIGKDFNGVLAMQFLQTEAMIDMMESARLYENSPLRTYRFYAKALSEEQLAAAKRNTIKKALGLSDEQEAAFWEVYSRYEEECNATLGENYDIFSVFAGEASDFTPALAKRLGYNFLTLMKREIKLKEKYFEEMNRTVGSSLAARFLAWEDYYSVVSKMYTWADAP
jgi:hypothetical protein